VGGNFHLADVTLPWWRVTSDWLKLHCSGGGYLGDDAWGVNEQGFRWASEGPNFIVKKTRPHHKHPGPSNIGHLPTVSTL
jgi:hypothetical protein